MDGNVTQEKLSRANYKALMPPGGYQGIHVACYWQVALHSFRFFSESMMEGRILENFAGAAFCWEKTGQCRGGATPTYVWGVVKPNTWLQDISQE